MFILFWGVIFCFWVYSFFYVRSLNVLYSVVPSNLKILEEKFLFYSKYLIYIVVTQTCQLPFMSVNHVSYFVQFPGVGLYLSHFTPYLTWVNFLNRSSGVNLGMFFLVLSRFIISISCYRILQTTIRRFNHSSSHLHKRQ